MRATRNIRNITNPERKNTGTIVRKSTIPSNDTRKRSLERPLLLSGYKYSAVHIRRIYSTQKINIVTYSTPLNTVVKNASSSNVCKKVTSILATIVTVMKMSNIRLIGLLLSPICIILNIFSFNFIFS